MIEFRRPDGGLTPAYQTQAARPDAPGVVVIQEWWGLNPQIRSVVDRLAAAGYTALAPDLYRGRLTTEADEANHLMQSLDFVDATHQDLRGAAAHLAQGGQPVAVMGFCMGGALTVAAAVHVPGLAAAACFYGVPPAHLAQPHAIAIPFQGHFAEQDDWCTPTVARGLEAEMRDAGRTPDIHFYPAGHGFFNATRAVYDAASAELAWQRLMNFFGRHLSAPR
ncbi:dienelactone hydrolase family protein [Inhella sp. 4Y17]|uniref:Dienelactone hydrolase family protein n=2 Tax=Inhella gelatinilytica TaxID=2795030 RepID=A0A931IX84_9BURK|nr:dienelactone hydrolase family protein [Inhella gelatinilytica]